MSVSQLAAWIAAFWVFAYFGTLALGLAAQLYCDILSDRRIKRLRALQQEEKR